MSEGADAGRSGLTADRSVATSQGADRNTQAPIKPANRTAAAIAGRHRVDRLRRSRSLLGEEA